MTETNLKYNEAMNLNCKTSNKKKKTKCGKNARNNGINYDADVAEPENFLGEEEEEKLQNLQVAPVVHSQKKQWPVNRDLAKEFVNAEQSFTRAVEKKKEAESGEKEKDKHKTIQRN